MKFFGRLLLFVIIVAIAGGAWVMFTGKSSAKADVVIKNEKEIYSRLRAVEPSYYADDYGTIRVYGSVKNESKQNCVYAKFDIELRDKGNKLVKEIKVTVRDIAANTTKSYDVNGGAKQEGLRVKGRISEAGFAKR
ncbi:MAG: hypothetical protein IBX64_08010 [Actinobacteria bacterium]|nr:hypothetical protein [Actinomycetota bacterium]